MFSGLEQKAEIVAKISKDNNLMTMFNNQRQGWIVYFSTGGELPDSLKGAFTSRQYVDTAVQVYLANRGNTVEEIEEKTAPQVLAEVPITIKKAPLLKKMVPHANGVGPLSKPLPEGMVSFKNEAALKEPVYETVAINEG